MSQTATLVEALFPTCVKQQGPPSTGPGLRGTPTPVDTRLPVGLGLGSGAACMLPLSTPFPGKVQRAKLSRLQTWPCPTCHGEESLRGGL